MDEQPKRGRLGARIDDAVERWGVPAILIAGLALIFGGLGQSGLWDPWEMDRADLGRRLIAPTQIGVALGASSEMRSAINTLSEELELVPRISELSRSKAKSRL